MRAVLLLLTPDALRLGGVLETLYPALAGGFGLLCPALNGRDVEDAVPYIIGRDFLRLDGTPVTSPPTTLSQGEHQIL